MSLLRSSTIGNGLSQLKRDGRRDYLQKQAGGKQEDGEPIMMWNSKGFWLELQPRDNQLLPPHGQVGRAEGHPHSNLSLLPSQDLGQWLPLAGSNQKPEDRETPVRQPLEVTFWAQSRAEKGG